MNRKGHGERRFLVASPISHSREIFPVTHIVLLPKLKTVHSLASLILLVLFLPMHADARFVQDLDVKTLMERSQLVFVGKVRSVKPSGITTALTYPTWEGVVFEWLKVEVEVVESVKGTKKREVVQTLMLSIRGPGPTINSPGMVDPKVGQYHLLCLLPTSNTGVFASVTAPFDDDQAIFLLDRQCWMQTTYYKDGKEVAFHDQSEKNRVLWNLVDDKGEINRDGAEYLRKTYKTEIATPHPKETVIHLKWKTETSAGGWQRDVPDKISDGTGNKKAKTPDGPLTRP